MPSADGFRAMLVNAQLTFDAVTFTGYANGQRRVKLAKRIFVAGRRGLLEAVEETLALAGAAVVEAAENTTQAAQVLLEDLAAGKSCLMLAVRQTEG